MAVLVGERHDHVRVEEGRGGGAIGHGELISHRPNPRRHCLIKEAQCTGSGLMCLQFDIYEAVGAECKRERFAFNTAR